MIVSIRLRSLTKDAPTPAEPRPLNKKNNKKEAIYFVLSFSRPPLSPQIQNIRKNTDACGAANKCKKCLQCLLKIMYTVF